MLTAVQRCAKQTSKLNRPERWLVALLLVAVFWLTRDTPQARAEASAGTEWTSELALSDRRVTAISDPDENCLMCHSDPDFKGAFQDGELISLYVDKGEYEQSIHGPAGLNCVACHTDISRYPHHVEEQVTCTTCHPLEGGQPDTDYVTLRVQLSFADRREMTLAINEECRSCHEHEFEVAVDSAHVRVFEGGNRYAPICVDCHGSHAITNPEEPRPKISHICGECHKAVYSTYRTSVHGTALETESNPDVPSCVECHGVHSVRGPRATEFRNDSIVICGGCHGDKDLMTKYGISTAVFETYLDDFHGRTVNFFRRESASSQSNKAVCFDCHGIHNIRGAGDPLATIYPANLQHTCQQCHEDASIRFPDAWLSHYAPTLEETPALYVVNWAYRVLISVTLGGMLLYIGLDWNKGWRDRRKALRRARALAERELESYDFTRDI